VKEKHIIMLSNKVPVEVRQSVRARQVRIVVYPDGAVVATHPSYILYPHFYMFLESKIDWIQEKRSFFQKHTVLPVPRVRHSKKEYRIYQEKTRQLVQDRLLHFNQFYGFTYKRIFIRNQKTRWGSCSKAGNLNFNYKLCLLPPHLADYIVVHELCHLGELNHSTRFWSLVQKTMPMHKHHRQELKKITRTL
jgi:predicted metal-dependent hydrolase